MRNEPLPFALRWKLRNKRSAARVPALALIDASHFCRSHRALRFHRGVSQIVWRAQISTLLAHGAGSTGCNDACGLSAHWALPLCDELSPMKYLAHYLAT